MAAIIIKLLSIAWLSRERNFINFFIEFSDRKWKLNLAAGEK
jgi:hypothetical protein